MAPVGFLVTDRGYLVTLDNWHNMGFGKAIASYARLAANLLVSFLGAAQSTL